MTDQAFGDYLAIQNLLATYVIAVDTRAIELFGQVFTPEAEINLAGMGAMTPASYADACRKNLPNLDATHHQLGLPAIRLAGEQAESRTYFLAQHTKNGVEPSPHLLIGGWYDDRFARTMEGWRIVRRIGTAVWHDGNPAILGYPLPPGAPPRGEGHEAPGWLPNVTA